MTLPCHLSWPKKIDDQAAHGSWKIKGKDLGLSGHPIRFTLFQLNLKEGLLYIEYGPELHCTVLKLPGTQFNDEEDEGTFLPLIPASFYFCYVCNS